MSYGPYTYRLLAPVRERGAIGTFSRNVFYVSLDKRFATFAEVLDKFREMRPDLETGFPEHAEDLLINGKQTLGCGDNLFQGF